jgi:dinuclear metal center YbgI/SA1388 family protein
MSTVRDVMHFLRRFAPLELAEAWDNVGLLLGDLGDEPLPVERVMTCLTVTPESASEAVTQRAQLIVTHHPVLFHAAKRLTAEHPQQRMLLDLIRAGVAVYSPHTAFDNTEGGINDILARRLGLGDVRPLRAILREGQCKLVVFVPDADLQKVSDALFQAGAGQIGEYTECSYRLSGTGTFHGSEAAHPALGQKGRREEVAEWRLEVICPEAKVADAVRAMRAAHSYEEPAFDIYPLRTLAKVGAGRLGSLPQPEPLSVFADRVRQQLRATHVQVVSESAQPVQRVAIACGAGGSLLNDALRQRADVFLTGEMPFHDQLAAKAQGIAVVLPGHYATERPGVEELAEIIQKAFPGLRVWPSQRECEPTRFSRVS